MPFRSVFQVNEDGSITALVNVRVAGVTIPQDKTISPGLVIGAIDLTQYTSNDLGIEVEGDTYVIRSIYEPKTTENS
jgi:hypothetical protein